MCIHTPFSTFRPSSSIHSTLWAPRNNSFGEPHAYEAPCRPHFTQDHYVKLECEEEFIIIIITVMDLKRS